MTFEELRRGLVSTKDAVRIQYNTREQFKRTSKLLGLMDDFKVKRSVRSVFINLIHLDFDLHRAAYQGLAILVLYHFSTTINAFI